MSSLTLDSTSFSYDFDIYYDFFHSDRNMIQHNVGVSGVMAKSYQDFYVGSEISYDFYRISDSLLTTPKFIASISPFIKKRTQQWNFKLGFQALLDKNMTDKLILQFYPDISFGFTIVPSYIQFFTGLSGKLEKNEPLKIISENPYLVTDGTLFTQPNTDHELIVFAGFNGNTGLGGNYQLSASYSLISDMLFYSNIVFLDSVYNPGRGNFFAPLTDDIELLNIHAEMSGAINDKLSFYGIADLYKYSMTSYDFAWNKPDWDGKLGLKYNLRDKVIAGVELSAEGKRKMIVSAENLRTLTNLPVRIPVDYVDAPAHFNLNLSAEYRYSKILSFWTKLNNLSFNRYYEWSYYPSKRFLFMLGFTYSL